MSAQVDSARRWLKPLQAAFTPLAIICLAIMAYRNREAILDLVVRADLPLLVLALLVWALLHLLSPATTWLVLRGMRLPMSYADVLDIHVRRLPARYIPGGIWHTVSRAVDLGARGVGRAELAALILVENAAPLAVSLVMGGAFALAAGDTRLPARAIICAGILLAVVLPWIQSRLFPGSPRLSVKAYFLVLCSIGFFWLVAGSVFAIYLWAFPGTAPEGRLPDAFAAYLLSWAAGFVAVFAPQGLGVFESVASILLDGALTFGGMAALIAGFRGVMIAGDTLAFSSRWIVRQAAALSRG